MRRFLCQQLPKRWTDSGNPYRLHGILFSAGGPVLDGAADVMVLTPVCAHNVHTAPLVFAAKRTLEIVADAENRETCYASADSGPQHTLQPGQRMRVTAAPRKLQLITFQDSEQFCAIENKLMRR